MPYEVELLRCESIQTAVVRGRVPVRELSRFVPEACGRVWTFARAAGLPRPGRHTALYLGDDSVEVGAEVSAPFTGTEEFHCSQLPAGPTAHAVHFGPYGGLREAHTAVREWCAEHGHRPTGVVWEIYGHWQDSWNSDPSQIRTDVFHLLE
jgi:effector-binding domain-containing protein